MNLINIEKITLAILIVFFFTGCGRGEKAQNLSGAKDTLEEQKDYIYVAENVDLASSLPVQSVCFDEDILYITTYDEATKDNRGFRIHCRDKESSPFRLPLETVNQSEVWQTEINEEGNLVFVEKYSVDNGKAAFLLKTVSVTDWKLLSSVDITDAVGADCTWITSLAVDKDGNCYLSKNKDILLLDSTGKLLCELHPNVKWILDMSRTKDGRVAFLAALADETKGLVLSVLDAKEKGVVQSYEGIEGGNAEGGLIPAADADLLVNCNGAVYNCDLQDGSMQEELCWNESMLNSEEIRYFTQLSDGNFVAVLWQHGAPGKLAYLTKTLRSEVPQKEKLVLATGGNNNDLNELVNYFNSRNTDYYVEIREYGIQVSSTETLEQVKTELILDILSDNAPDIIDAKLFETAVLAASGGIEDLTPFLENDPELKEVEFFEAVLRMNTLDGKLYSIPDYFRISTLAAKAEDVGAIPNITLETLRKMAEEYSGEADFISLEKAFLLYYILEGDLSKWMNWETGECSFDSEEFKEIIEFCQKYGQDVGAVQTTEEEPTVGVLEPCYFFNVLDYKALNIILGGSPVLVGYPVEEDSGNNGAKLDGVQKFMICAKSNHKEGAWEFLKCFLSQEYYDLQLETQPDQMCFPSRVDVYNQAFDVWMRTETIPDENGVEQTVGKYEYNGGWGRFGREPITEQDREVITELIKNASGGDSIRGEIRSIFDEELAPYFLGQKSADEVMKIIQNRVQLYMDENR